MVIRGRNLALALGLGLGVASFPFGARAEDGMSVPVLPLKTTTPVTTTNAATSGDYVDVSAEDFQESLDALSKVTDHTVQNTADITALQNRLAADDSALRSDDTKIAAANKEIALLDAKLSLMAADQHDAYVRFVTSIKGLSQDQQIAAINSETARLAALQAQGPRSGLATAINSETNAIDGKPIPITTGTPGTPVLKPITTPISTGGTPAAPVTLGPGAVPVTGNGTASTNGTTTTPTATTSSSKPSWWEQLLTALLQGLGNGIGQALGNMGQQYNNNLVNTAGLTNNAIGNGLQLNTAQRTAVQNQIAATLARINTQLASMPPVTGAKLGPGAVRVLPARSPLLIARPAGTTATPILARPGPQPIAAQPIKINQALGSP